MNDEKNRSQDVQIIVVEDEPTQPNPVLPASAPAKPQTSILGKRSPAFKGQPGSTSDRPLGSGGPDLSKLHPSTRGGPTTSANLKLSNKPQAPDSAQPRRVVRRANLSADVNFPREITQAERATFEVLWRRIEAGNHGDRTPVMPRPKEGSRGQSNPPYNQRTPIQLGGQPNPSLYQGEYGTHQVAIPRTIHP